MMCVRKLVLAAAVVGWVSLVIGGVALADEEPQVDLKVGDLAPLFETVDDNGKPWNLSDHVGKKVVVLYFCRADFTTGCRRQAEAWRDNMNLAAGAGVEVVGISADSVQTHKLFKQVWNLTFTLLSDPEAQVPKKYGVPVRRGGRVQPRGPNRNHLLGDDGERLVVERPATFVRWTFVIGKDGKIAYKNTKVRAAKDSEQVLDFLQVQKLPKQLAGK
jgi:peroxiredoxin Q/BCP